ncbi:M16 family metallopeptidase [Spartinivicinus ruber]|uniref:M16 family metallopeptidase n=1 Tax=Spartinivicinus ruber TaxID=2683272 RepID=UPI0013D7D8D3|nr:pitrilysin family protein [Spartinivicinus ruber]
MVPLRRSLLALSVCALLSGGYAITTTASTPAKGYSQTISLPSIQYEKFTLPNGLTVIVHEDRKAPVIAVNVWYKVGSKDEVPGKTGFAHLFEHLMFQGSENYKGEFFEPFEKAGATDQNGTTNSDRTNYFETVPTNALDMALWMESDRMGHFLGSITKAKLDEQRGVVQNEKRQGENQPYGKVWELITKASFPSGHPYSWETIGSMEDLNAASLEDVKNWFKQYYGPNNAILVLSGDIDAATAKSKALQYFGDIPPGPSVTKAYSWVAPLTENKRFSMTDRVPQSRLIMVWNTPASGTKEAEQMSLVANLLSSGKQSRLYKRLVHDDKLASSVSVFNHSRQLAGQLFIMADAKPGISLAKLERAIKEELSRLQSSGPTLDELALVKTQQAAGFIRQLERVGGFGGKSDILAAGEFYANDPAFYLKSYEYQKKTSPADIRKVMKKWLTKGKVVVEVEPTTKLTKTKSTVDRSAVPGAGEVKPFKLPEVSQTTLSNGLKVLLASRPGTSTVEMDWLFDAGYAADAQHSPGTANFTLAMMKEGTKSKDSIALDKELSKLGADISVGSSVDSSSVSLSALKDNIEKSVALAADVIQNPAFRAADFDRLRSNWLDSIAQEKARPFSTALRVLPQLLYGVKHAYSTPWTGSGTEESITRLNIGDLTKFHKQWVRPDNAQLIVVGDIHMEELKPLLEKQLGKWQAPKTPMPVKNLADATKGQDTQIYLVDKPGAIQSTIIAGQLLPSSKDDRSLTMKIANTILGGQFSARLNMNLREDKHWSYGAYSKLNSAVGQRPFIMYASVQTDKTSPALQELQKEVKQYVSNKPASADELKKVKDNWLRSKAGAYETNGALLSAISGLLEVDRPLDDLYNFDQRVSNISLKDVQQVSKELLEPNKLTWVIVGDLKKIEPSITQLKLGKVTKLDKNGNPL